jgi:hypothetical protein
MLYQEMLTGVLPFSGVTAAELTMQHLNDEPDMSPLPIADRYVLARALSKDSSNRFESCSDLIRALIAAPTSDGGDWSANAQVDRGTHGFEAVLPERRSERRRGPVTEFFDEQITAPRREISKSMLLDWEPPADTEPRRLPAVEIPAEAFAAQPTLVIGIGGTAAAVLRQLRLRLAKQYGDDPLPAVQMLLLDSDPKTIAQSLQGDVRSALKAEETLTLPLKRPQEYREQSARLMRWLSRRWLYNIPKSLRTEGLRPLGRLAFADHARQAVQRVRMALSQATDAESIKSSTEHAKLPFRSGTARVYLVASISGGTGSGVSLDLAYAVRTALEKAGLSDAQVVGIFLHATGHDPRHCDLARVNAYAWLTEYNHFHRPGGEFPGDESCGLPPLAAGKRALDSAYLIEMEAELESSELEAAAQSVAEYVYLDALTPAQAFFNECRRDPAPGLGGTAALRTFTLRKIPAAEDASIEDAAARLTREVALRWTGSDEAARLENSSADALLPSAAKPLRDTNQLVQGSAKLVGHLQLTLEGLASNARGLIEGQFGGDQQAFIDNLVQLSQQESQATSPAEMARIADCVFAAPSDQEEGAFVLQRPLEAIISPLTMKLAGDLARWVLQKLDDRQERLAGAQGAALWLVEHLTRLEADASRLATGLARQIAACAQQLRQDVRTLAPNDDDWQQASSYFRMRTDQQAVLASALIARRLLTELRSVSDTVAEFGRHLKNVAMSMPAPERKLGADDPLAGAVSEHLTALSDAVDEQLQNEFIAPSGGLFQTIMGNSRVRAQMLTELAKRARRVAEQLATRPDVVESSFAAGSLPGAGGASGQSAEAPPRLLEHGGAYRGLAVLPQSTGGASQVVVAALGSDASVLTGVGHDIVLCQEGWDLPLAKIAVDVIHGRRDYADFAGRVATRSDVAWTPLAAPPAAAFPDVAAQGAFAESMPAMTQVL